MSAAFNTEDRAPTASHRLIETAELKIDSLRRGVLYGQCKAPSAIQLYANGLLLATIDAEETAQSFVVNVNSGLLLEAPVTLRARLVTGEPIDEFEWVLTEPQDVEDSLVPADGEIILSGGVISGFLRNVNPDALPLTVSAAAGGREFALCEVRRPAGRGSGGKALIDLPFSIPLPVGLLDGKVATVHVRLRDDARDFEGSPIVFSASHGDTIEQRLARLEQGLLSLTTTVEELGRAIRTDVHRHFYGMVMPRVDAAVQGQRIALERQMAALWLECTGSEPSADAMHAHPMETLIALKDGVSGLGWLPASATGALGRWFHERALIATEISATEDAFLEIRGSAAASPEAARALQILANGHPISLWVDQSHAPWRAFAVIPRAVLNPSGSLSLELVCPVEDQVDLGGEAATASLAVATVRIASGANHRSGGARTLDDHVTLAGFYGREQTGEGLAFRWMSGRGLLLARIADRSADHLLRVSGPFMLNERAQASLRGRLISQGETAREAEFGAGWRVDIAVPRRSAGGPSLHLIELTADASQPSSEDRRLLSAAVSDLAILAQH
ncbi:hypothetical protein [Sphingomonas morindae]|uniref:Uncharacterized protein n=1 Tax=Sphingomonas morindae TaxID=1541170 RepID=A0ABY4X638_9SPHN|nr:hypothetical protein [Sphingomonas morindae]USI72355.1 hypothetical protein LHA26_13795 [Sphingomonas morindae]